MPQGGVTCTVSGKQITLNGTAMISFNFCLFPALKVDDFSSYGSIPVKANASYHLSVSVISGYCNSSVTPWIRDSQGNIVQNGEGTFTPSTTLTGCIGIWIPAGATFNNYIIEEQLLGTICGVSKVTVNGIDYAVPQELFDNDSYNFISGKGITADNKPITGTPQTISVTMPTTITNDNGGQMVVIYPAIFERVAYTSRAFDHHTIHELMRMYTLQAAVANTDSVRRYITPGVSLECDGQLYDLTGYKKESGSNNTTSFDAEHVGYRLLNYQIQPGYSFVGTVAQIAADILDVAVDSKGNKASSEFEIGETPDLGTISFTLNNTDVVTAKYAIMALKNFGAESDYDNFTINFYQQIGGGQTQTFEFGVNMENVTITYSLTNGTTYEANIADLQIKDPEDHPFGVGWYGHGIDSTTGEEFTKRIITYDKCHDNPSQNKISLGVFVSDVSTQTAQMSVDINNSIKQGEDYNNNSISRKDGIKSTDSSGNKIIQMGGENGLELFVKQSDGTLKRVGYFDYNGLATANIVGTINGTEDTKAIIGLLTFTDGSTEKGLLIRTNESPDSFVTLSQGAQDALGTYKASVSSSGDLAIISNAHTSNPEEQQNKMILSEGTDKQGAIEIDRAAGQGTLKTVFIANRDGTAMYSPDGSVRIRAGKDNGGNNIIEFDFNNVYQGYIAADGYHGLIDGHAGYNGTLQSGSQTLQVMNGRILE